MTLVCKKQLRKEAVRFGSRSDTLAAGTVI